MRVKAQACRGFRGMLPWEIFKNQTARNTFSYIRGKKFSFRHYSSFTQIILEKNDRVLSENLFIPLLYDKNKTC